MGKNILLMISAFITLIVALVLLPIIIANTDPFLPPSDAPTSAFQTSDNQAAVNTKCPAVPGNAGYVREGPDIAGNTWVAGDGATCVVRDVTGSAALLVRLIPIISTVGLMAAAAVVFGVGATGTYRHIRQGGAG